MKRHAIQAILCGATLISGCGRAATEPTGPEITVIIAIVASSDAQFTAVFDADTIRAPGAYTATLTPGTYRIGGSFSGGALGIGFSSLSSGGVQYGSVKSIRPPADVDPCQVSYFGSEETQPQKYELEFRVTEDDLNTCFL